MTTAAHLYVDQGVDYIIQLDLFTNLGEDFATLNYSFYSSVKKLYSETKAFDIEVIVNENDGDINNIELFISADKTKNLKPGKYHYDILMRKEGAKTEKLLEGLLFLLPTVTTIEE